MFAELYTDATVKSWGIYLVAKNAGSGVIEIEKNGAFDSPKTNNEGEYLALIQGLEFALGSGYRNLAVYSDSELMIQQVRNKYKVKAEHLKILRDKVLKLFSRFNVIGITHIRGLDNPADRISREVSNGPSNKVSGARVPEDAS